jgi:NitT/TauT family transport system substrate-binding protein
MPDSKRSSLLGLNRRSEMRRVAVLVTAMLMTGAVFAGCGGDDSSGDSQQPAAAKSAEKPTNIKVFFPFRETLFYRYFSVAAERGYFKKENLNVELVDAGGGAPAMQQLLAGNGMVAMAPASDVLVGMQKDPNLTAFYGIGNVNIFDIVVPADSDIQSVKDLAGKPLGITNFKSGEVPYVRAALAGAGLSFDGDVPIRVVTDSPPSFMRALKSGQIKAFAGSSFETTPLKAAGMEIRSIMPEELLQVPSNTLVTKNETLEDPKGKQAMIGLARALAKGEQFAEANPDAALCVSKKRVPEDHEDADFAKLFSEVTTEQLKADDPQRWGEQSVDEWKRLQDVLLVKDQDGEAVLKSPIENLEPKVSNDLIPEINDWDRGAVDADAKSHSVTYPDC